MNQELKAYYRTVAELLKEQKQMEAYRIFTGGDLLRNFKTLMK